ncbi:carbohydrate ABC transporter permease [Phytoactinopolyspora mesophila]|uniref:ABC transporter permease subunit n=1 Tax=Phytoactinopolyspora mesophila TaxID=2650750 RepID=A0A7K3LXC4_9ACTN|nr:carbohydrate ABC transporter permease [Phytoactinopolyspora mesophila]NDL55679.1 ABC transporter permease subunit [Phytoactinopolyspora mesophila]
MSVHSQPRALDPNHPVPAEPARRSGRDQADLGGRTLNVFSHAFLLTWAVLVILPLLWTVLNSFKSDDEILTSAWSLPGSFSLDSFVRAWTTANIGQYFLNTAVVVSLGVFLTLGLGSLVAYVIARYPFPGNRVIYFLFVAGLTFPVFLAIVPLFFVARSLQLANSLPGLALIYTAYYLPFAVFFLTAYFRTLPDSIADAAFIDGCGHWRTFFWVMLPMARPGMISVGIFVTIGQWNQFLLPLVLQTDPDKYVIAQGLASLAVSQEYASDWSGLFAGLTLSMIPVLVVYIVFQRQIESGMVAGAVK